MNVAVRRLAILALLAPLMIVGTGSVASASTTSTGASGCERTLPSYPVVRVGDRGPAVRTLQCALNDVGIAQVAVDGWYGPQTKRAVAALTSTFEGGPPEHPYRVDAHVWTVLYAGQLSSQPLAEGALGSRVAMLQRTLRAAGGEIVVDGYFGPQTRDVVAAYQRRWHLDPTGRYDENTALQLDYGAPF